MRKIPLCSHAPAHHFSAPQNPSPLLYPPHYPFTPLHRPRFFPLPSHPRFSLNVLSNEAFSQGVLGKPLSRLGMSTNYVSILAPHLPRPLSGQQLIPALSRFVVYRRPLRNYWHEKAPDTASRCLSKICGIYIFRSILMKNDNRKTFSENIPIKERTWHCSWSKKIFF